MIGREHFEAVLADVEPPAGYKLIVIRNNGGFALQVRGFEPDAVTGEAAPEQGHGGRKWPLSRNMTRSEIVQTALKALLTYAEHEIREGFRWRGRAIFGPHIDVEVLHAICDRLDARKMIDVEHRGYPVTYHRASQLWCCNDLGFEADSLDALKDLIDGEIAKHAQGIIDRTHAQRRTA